MSETREAYNVAMQPGEELDALCAVVMGYITGPIIEIIGGKGINANGDSVLLPDVSTDPSAAMEAWAWLEENHPWVEQGNAWPWQQGIKAAVLLGTDYIGQEDNPRPSVLVMQRADWWSFPNDEMEEGTKEGRCFFIPGDTYPHAISLAVVEAGRALKLVDI